MQKMRRLVVELSGLGLVVVLLLLVGLVPPDTSLLEMRKTGALKVCVPTSYPPLVTGDPDQPGIDIEILLAISDYIGVELLMMLLVVTSIRSIGMLRAAIARCSPVVL